MSACTHLYYTYNAINMITGTLRNKTRCTYWILEVYNQAFLLNLASVMSKKAGVSHISYTFVVEV